MKEKRTSANWRIALMHYFIAGFLGVLLLRFVLVYGGDFIGLFDIFESIARKDNLLAFLAFEIIFDVLPIWIGVTLSAKYLREKYIIEDETTAIKLSTMLLIAFPCIILIALASIPERIDCTLCEKLFLPFFMPLDVGFQMFGVLSIIMVFSIMAFTFYIFSKKYLGNTKILDAIKSISSFTKPKIGDKKKTIWGIKLFAVFTIIAILAVVLIGVFSSSRSPTKTEDSRIVSAIAQTRTVMSQIYAEYGNYDNFICDSPDMKFLCQEIDENYKPINGAEPIIAHDAPNNSQAACIYSPLVTKKKYWYCADSTGNVGFTKINPGNSGYCVEGKSATCPPLLKDIP